MAAAQVKVFTCAVCLFDVPVTDSVLMPCCDRDESTMKYCRRCIEIICTSGVGRCPTCRGHIAIQDGTVSVTTFRARCAICCNIKEIIDNNLCDACLLGSRYPLTYECQRCHRKQVIRHPMWRYQASPDEFGTATWACHQQCGDYKHIGELCLKMLPRYHQQNAQNVGTNTGSGCRESASRGSRRCIDLEMSNELLCQC